MAKLDSAAVDQVVSLLAHDFIGTGQSPAVHVEGRFNLSIYGSGNGTVQIERSFDGGTTWIPLSKDFDGNIAAYNPNTNEISLIADEPESGMLYRFNCTAHTSGTINTRIST